MNPNKCLEHRHLTVKPLLDACFTWAKQNLNKVFVKGKAANSFTYSINKEKYIKTFLVDGLVPIDNNYEQSIREFYVG